MTTEEPQWPSISAVFRSLVAPEADGAVVTDTGPSAIAAHAIEMCRAAWLAANDDPSKSPVGEVRQSPSGVRFVAREDTETLWRWIAIDNLTPNVPSAHADTAVKGWRVLGNIPEAQQ